MFRMRDDFSIVFRDKDRPRGQKVHIEVVGDMFILYNDLWRTDPCAFDDLVMDSEMDSRRIYNVYNGAALRNNWQMTVIGNMPDELASRLPKLEKPMLSNSAMLAIAFLCLAIVHSSAQILN
jgi:hypothetical protein